MYVNYITELMERYVRLFFNYTYARIVIIYMDFDALLKIAVTMLLIHIPTFK